jgi:hypothetical protein
MEFVEVQGKMKPKNGQNFPLLDGQDITPGSIAETQLTPVLRDKVNNPPAPALPDDSITESKLAPDLRDKVNNPPAPTSPSVYGMLPSEPLTATSFITNAVGSDVGFLNSTSAGAFVQEIKLCPFTIGERTRITTIGVRKTTSANGAFRIAIFSSRPNKLPFQRLVFVNSVVFLAVGLYQFDIDFIFEKDTLYWLAVQQHTAFAPLERLLSSCAPRLGDHLFGQVVHGLLSNGELQDITAFDENHDFLYGSMTSNIQVTNTTSVYLRDSSMPVVYMRRALIP